MRSKVDLPDPLRPKTPIAWKERQADVAQYYALGGYHLRYPIHREYVLGQVKAHMRK